MTNTKEVLEALGVEVRDATEEEQHKALHEEVLRRGYKAVPRGDGGVDYVPDDTKLKQLTVNDSEDAKLVRLIDAALLTLNPNEQRHKYRDCVLGVCGQCGHERDYVVHRTPYNEQGLIDGKYVITRADGKTEDPEARFFVLRYDKDDGWGQKCRDALRSLCVFIVDYYPLLAHELLTEIDSYEPNDRTDTRCPHCNDPVELGDEARHGVRDGRGDIACLKPTPEVLLLNTEPKKKP